MRAVEDIFESGEMVYWMEAQNGWVPVKSYFRMGDGCSCGMEFMFEYLQTG